MLRTAAGAARGGRNTCLLGRLEVSCQLVHCVLSCVMSIEHSKVVVLRSFRGRRSLGRVWRGRHDERGGIRTSERSTMFCTQKIKVQQNKAGSLADLAKSTNCPVWRDAPDPVTRRQKKSKSHSFIISASVLAPLAASGSAAAALRGRPLRLHACRSTDSIPTGPANNGAAKAREQGRAELRSPSGCTSLD